MTSKRFMRKKEFLKERKILIVCEGEKTEPNYFRKFPIKNKEVRVEIIGTGSSSDTLIEKAIEYKENVEVPYIQVWCVFDKDNNSIQSINRAFELADNNKIKIAYSNEAFELWYILHFEYLNSGISREQYITKLNKLLNHTYKKNSEVLYDELKNKQWKAIKNAEKLLAKYKPYNPAIDNPYKIFNNTKSVCYIY